MTSVTIALDAMGGDHGPSVIVPAAIRILKQAPELRLILVGDQQVLREVLQLQITQESERLIIHHASQKVEMDESPSHALRTKKDSSMRVAINLVKEGQAQACVSAGNTGALVATARFVLKTLSGIDRPAIIFALPTVKKDFNVRVLDLGANVDCTPEHLFQFAVMGSVLVSAVEDIPRPTVGLLNVGEEDIKGNEQVKKAAQLLTASVKTINYIGNVEGDDIYKGVADVVVCDGFVGNAMLKASEGLARMIMQYIKEAFQRNWLTYLSGLAAMRVLKSVKNRVDPARYNGASLIGLRGTVIKSHGGADTDAFANAIQQAMLEVEKDIPQRIRHQVAELLEKRPLT